MRPLSDLFQLFLDRVAIGVHHSSPLLHESLAVQELGQLTGAHLAKDLVQCFIVDVDLF